MYNLGLVSVSFRSHTPEEILAAMRESGLSAVEWGSDIHAPATDGEKTAHIARLQSEYGIRCCSYGTYFRMGVQKPEEIYPYIRAAKQLGTDIIRIWCGNRSPVKYTEEEKRSLFDEALHLTEIAENEKVTLCLECHIGTWTETAEAALELMQLTASPHFRMYWQPNQFRSRDENLRSAEALAAYTHHIHCFHWIENSKLPLAKGIDIWREYLSRFQGEHHVLLEFMPDGLLSTLEVEAKTLKNIVKGL